MGVSGLLPLLKSIQRPEKLDKYKGETIGVDGYVWLHRGAHGCALELVRGQETRDYVKYALSRIRMMRHFGVHPYLVFDGDYLPSKKLTEDQRAKRRDASRKVALDLYASGKTSQALTEAQKCVDVTPEMARELITELQRLNVPYVVAPYEADAQLVYLERQGMVDAILSEDSDLLVFGAKRLLTKLDKYGALVEINRRDFASCREVLLAGWTDADFRRMAIFSGCDYIKGLPQIGLKKAHGLLRKYKTPEKVVRMVLLEGKIRVPENFLSDFAQAELTFLHQRVYCPTKKELVMLTEPAPDSGVEEMDFIGAPLEPEIARAVACGDINPITKLTMVPIKTPDSAKRRHSQFAGLHSGPATATTTPRPPHRPIDSYFSPRQSRIPLGEMDTNCFSVDKQRLAALTDNGRTSVVFPLPRPYLDNPAPSRAQRRRTEPISSLIADLSGSPAGLPTPNASSNTFPSRTPSMSGRPQKKARLCADTDLPATKSKFFGKAASLGTQRRHTQNFPMSDSSIDAALAELPDVDTWATGRSRTSVGVLREVDIYCDTETEKGESENVAVSDDVGISEDTTDATENVPEDAPEDGTEDVEVPASDAVEVPASDAVEAPVSPPTRVSRRSLLQFSYTPQSTRSVSTSTSTSTTRSFMSSTSTTAMDRTPLSSVTTPATAPSRNLTPLQRIGARAMNRSAYTPSRASPAPADRLPRAPSPHIPSDPALVPLPRVDMDEIEALNKQVGSEDLIVPASDDEDGEYDEFGRMSTARVLDLGRFSYI